MVLLRLIKAQQHLPVGDQAGLEPVQVFDRLRGFLTESGQPGLAAALEGGGLLACTEGHAKLAAPPGFAASRLQQRRELLEEIFGRFFGRRTKVEVEARGTEQRRPGAAAAPVDPEVARATRQEALKDPGVNAVMEILRADIVEIRVLGAPR